MARLVDRIKGMTVEAVSQTPNRASDKPTPERPVAPAVAPLAGAGDTPPLASPEERIAFLRHSITFTESTIRAYDTKSQIAMAAFVVSMNPLWSILYATCAGVAQRPIVAVMLGAFIATILVYCFVLWPIKPIQDLIRNIRTKGLFYVHDPKTAASTYTTRLRELSVEPELAAEVLKLSFIRAQKGIRFKYALWATAGFYAFVFFTFLMLRECR
jgi:hypothetical protein